MTKVLLVQLDGKLPNIALMKLAAHHRGLGDEIVFQWHKSKTFTRDLFDGNPDRVYASLIFEKTRPAAEQLLGVYPEAVVGGSGWDEKVKLEQVGVTTEDQDYSLYPGWSQSIGFSQRGCRLKCPFCKVPRMEGKVQEVNSVEGLWRGDPWPRHLILLDNDFFGQPSWAEKIKHIREGKFKVNFSQGINARFLNDETAEAIASVDYRDVNMKDRRIYTAWDNRKDEDRLFRGLELLVKHGIRPRHIVVYILLGYWPWSDLADWEFRRKRLRDFGAFPYPMPFHRTRESVGFQRWVLGHYDKGNPSRVPWEDWVKADYQPRKLRLTS